MIMLLFFYFLTHLSLLSCISNALTGFFETQKQFEHKLFAFELFVLEQFTSELFKCQLFFCFVQQRTDCTYPIAITFSKTFRSVLR